MKNILYFLIAYFAFSVQTLPAEDDLGRLFLSPEQRAQLEELRHKNPEVSKIPDIVIDIEPEPEPEPEQKPEVGGIYLNGLVYRKNGKSTAWVNDANITQGDLGHRYLEIDAEKISEDNVEITIPSSYKKIKLKVGDYYDPAEEDE